jgi:hypothetical protein
MVTLEIPTRFSIPRSNATKNLFLAQPLHSARLLESLINFCD